MPAYYLEAFTVLLGICLLMAEAFVPTRSKSWIGLAGAAGLAAMIGLCFIAVGPSPEGSGTRYVWESHALWELYQFDGLARFYKILSLLATLLVLLMATDFRSILARFTDQPKSENGTGEYYPLAIFACAGMMWMASARDLAMAFVALELVTVSFYILVAFMRRNVGSLEAGVKFLILGALSTGFLVYGIAWVYGTTGTMNLDAMALAVPTVPNVSALLFGIALVIVGLGFKIGAVPMQMWIPDVYQGAPMPTTALLSVGSKAAGFVLLMRFLEPFLSDASPVRDQVLVLLSVLAAATLLFGNLAAIPQGNFKRLMGYSSIAHAGFLLLALAGWRAASDTTITSIDAVSFYLGTYLLMTLGAFFVLAQIRIQRAGEDIADFNGLGKSNPLIAGAMTVLLAALAGVPLTAGFWGKFFVFSLAVEARLWVGVAIACIAAGAGFYYYFKVIRAMWWAAPGDVRPLTLPIATKACLAFLTIAVLVLGIFPQPLLSLLH